MSAGAARKPRKRGREALREEMQKNMVDRPARPAGNNATPPVSVNWFPISNEGSSASASQVNTENHATSKTRCATLMEQYGMKSAELINAYISKAADTTIGLQCACGRGIRTTRCRECFQLPPLCKLCFLEHHKHLPFHWAELWDFTLGFFRRHDLSALDAQWAIDLGHEGAPCVQSKLKDTEGSGSGHCIHDESQGPACDDSKTADTLLINIIDTNGVHATRVRYCRCDGRPTKWQQLFRANLFPGSVVDPGTAYTFNVLREFQTHSEASKKHAYDYCKALRHLTDYNFSQDVPDFYKNFQVVSRLWAFVRANKWTGQGHSIDSVLPHRPPGNLGVYCPCCPEENVNMEPGWQTTPSELRHLHSYRRTLDGNFQLNHFSKDHDPSDVSLYQGRSIFPHHETEKKYIAEVPQLQADARRVIAEKQKGEKPSEEEREARKVAAQRRKEEKATCSYLKAIAKQNRKKFRGMDITGVVNVMCDHGVSEAMVDLQVGERFANTDFALAHAVERHGFVEGAVPDQVLSYDSQCNYCVHLLERFKMWFPKLAYLIRDFRFIIPSMHVRNHLDMCMYLFSSAFKECMGHFHGEGAEGIWAEFNALGAAVRQMSNGHRQDVIIQHVMGWNSRKVVNISYQLQRDLNYARRRYSQARENMRALYIIHADKVEIWNACDRSPRIDPKNRRLVHSVYAQSAGKALSYTQIIQKMLRSEDMVACGTDAVVQETLVGRFLKEALSIQDAQAHLRRKVKGLRDLGRLSDERAMQDVEERRSKLSRRIEKLRSYQPSVLPGMEDLVCVAKPGLLEDECLWLPSDVREVDHKRLGIKEVADMETALRKAIAWDTILELQATARMLSAAENFKAVHDRGQDQNTRSTTIINRYRARRGEQLEDYNRHRKALLNLGAISYTSDEWRELKEEDTFRKPTIAKPGAGASRRMDGALWTMGAGSTGSQDTRSLAPKRVNTVSSPIGTEMSSRKSKARDTAEASVGGAESPKRPAKRMKAEKEAGARTTEDGWIWRRGLARERVDEWAEEQEKVKFFRDEAEWERWREQVEIKHAEFHRCIRAFIKMSSIWTSLSAKTESTAGHMSYAKKQSALYKRLAEESQERFAFCGIEELREVPEGRTLAQQVAKWRVEEACVFPKLQSKCPEFVDPTLSTSEVKLPEPDDGSDEDIEGEEGRGQDVKV